MPPPTQESPTVSRSPWPLLALAVVAFTALVRGAMHFSTRLIPKMDGGYYPLQTRSLLRDGWLLLSDMPLTFGVQAMVAKGLMLLSHMEMDRAVLLASKIVDSIAPPLAAIPIVALGAQWAARVGRPIWPAAGAALLAVCSIPALSMVGDFQKNALAMVWFALGVWAMHRAIRRGDLLSWGVLAVFPLLTAITHVGTLGGLMGFIVLGLLAERVMAGRLSLKTLAIGGAIGLGVLLGLFLLLSVFDAGRARYFLRAPVAVFARPAVLSLFGGGGGPPVAPTFLYIVAIYALGIVTLRRLRGAAWGEGPRPERAECVVAAAGALCAMALCCPLLGDNVLHRTTLMSPVPAALALAFLFAHAKTAKRAQRLGAGAIALVVLPLAFAFGPMSGAIIPEECVEELKGLRTLVPAGKRTLIAARHGLEFWAGYFLDTDVRQDRVPEDAFATHDRVFILIQTKEPERGPGPGGRGPRPGGPGPGRPGGPGSGPGSPFPGLTIPTDARVLHRGEYFTLAEAAAPKSAR